MVSVAAFRTLALSLPGTEELPHFHLTSFRVNKKIFATLGEKDKRAILKLSKIDQSVFCSYDESIFYAVPGSWGKQGATFVNLSKVRKAMFKDALQCAYQLITEKNKSAGAGSK
jgi:predicted DNA-binding protein (MmcQ/YjbR family)